jgi:antirestriction protein
MSNYTKELTGAERDAYIAERFNKEEKMNLTQASKTSDTSAFFYVDGIPTKGAWIDLDAISEWDEIKEQLGAHLSIDADSIDEVLCADVEGIARHFYASNCDGFDLSSWLEFREELANSHLDVEVVDAYLKNMGTYGGVNISDIEDAYSGEFDSWEDFAIEMVDACGYLDQMPESIRSYFDYEKFGHDLSFDYFESDGYFFRNC